MGEHCAPPDVGYSCDALAGCHRSTWGLKKDILAATADSERCDKNDAKLTSGIAGQTWDLLSLQTKLSKSKRTEAALMGSMSHADLGEAADVAGMQQSILREQRSQFIN